MRALTRAVWIALLLVLAAAIILVFVVPGDPGLVMPWGDR